MRTSTEILTTLKDILKIEINRKQYISDKDDFGTYKSAGKKLALQEVLDFIEEMEKKK